MVGFALNQTIQTKQTQQLRLTPQLKQGIELIQMTTLELEAWVQARIQENPLLEVVEDDVEENSAFKKSLDVPQNTADVISADEQDTEIEVCAWSADVVKGGSGFSDDEASFPDIVQQASLSDLLLEQARWLKLDEVQQEVIEYLIGNLDEDGFLCDSLTELIKGLSQDEAQIEMLEPLFEEGLNVLQKFEPAGVGARNLVECLCLQVDRMSTRDSLKILVKRLLSEKSLKELAKPDIDELIQLYQIDRPSLREALDLIGHLDPQPVNRLGLVEEVAYILPDLRSFQSRGVWRVVMRDHLLPKLSINNHYCQLNRGGGDPKDAQIIKDWTQDAKQVIRHIEQRQSTLLLIGQEIAKRQQAFFSQGLRGLKPMVLRDVADAISVHESTVSRLVNGKYIQTPHGVFELRALFTSGFSGSMEHHGDSMSVSSATIQGLIADLIRQESVKKPYSDQKISDWLKEVHSLDVARRTVAKYRDVLGIPAASERRVRP